MTSCFPGRKGYVGPSRRQRRSSSRCALRALHIDPAPFRRSVAAIRAGRTIEGVLDERLVGYWSDEDLYQGAMEAADIAFRADGTGWTYWSRDGGTFYVVRFSWHTGANRNRARSTIS
jgi:hypothetical protein